MVFNDKLFLLLSHLFFLFPVSYFSYHYAWIHSLLMISVMITSFLFHYCDVPDHPSSYDLSLQYCMMPYTYLYLADFELSALTAINVLSYHMDASIETLRECSMVAIVVFNIYIYGIFGELGNSPYYYCFTGLLSVLIVFARIYIRYQQYGWTSDLLPLDRTLWVGVAALISFMLGFILYSVDDIDGHDYDLYLGLFHIFAGGLGILFGAIWIDLLPTEHDANPSKLSSRHHDHHPYHTTHNNNNKRSASIAYSPMPKQQGTRYRYT